MKCRPLGLASVVVALLVSIVGLPRAHADDQLVGSVAASGGVLYSGCQNIPYRLDLRYPLGSSWSVAATLIGPDGLAVSSDFTYNGSPTPDGLQVCASLTDPGIYTITASGEYWDASLRQEIAFSFTPAQISLRAPRSAVSARPSANRVKKGRKLKIAAQVRDERPNGLFATRYAQVRLEEKMNGRWYWISGTRKLTNAKGRATLTYVGRGKKTQLRVAVLTDGIYAPSVSKAFKVKAR